MKFRPLHDRVVVTRMGDAEDKGPQAESLFQTTATKRSLLRER